MFISIAVFILIRLLINRLQRRMPGRVIRIINWILIFVGIISWILLFWRFFTTVRTHVKPLPNNGGRLARKMHPIEYLNQTDELHLVSLASNPATPPPFRRGNNLSEFNFFTLAAVSPPLPQPVTQLTNNISICGYPQRNPPPRSKVYSTEASCFFRKINGEIN
uniref:Uncharacterized protein LOC104246558 n=1 Tax=Nicotiana sylvestris TaxID=4096 RepID=A0A1U7Y977_NICSY|nr:PREDICTED: uncharacterized protein LOC104246558 [Nicotiana sylvestris]